MNMFLTNKTRLKIKDIVKRISLDEPVALEERIYVENLWIITRRKGIKHRHPHLIHTLQLSL